MEARWIAAVVVSVSALAATARAEHWPQFRGPGASGLSDEDRLPREWGPEESIAWKVKLPGAAWSQPIVWGNRIYVTTAVTENQTPPAVGRQRGMARQGGMGRQDGGGNRQRPERPGRGASPGSASQDAPQDAPRDRPADAGPPRAEDADERPEGQRARRPGGAGRRPGGGGFGRGGAPPDQVYRYLVMCLDLSTGEVVWENLAHEGKPTISTHRTNTYASETPVTDGQRVYAYFGMTGLYCFDMDGKPLWSKDLGSYPMMAGWGTGSSPVLDDKRLFLQCDNEEASFLVALDKQTGEELWRVDRDERSNWSTPYIWKNKVRTELIAAGGGKMRSYDPEDGRLLWELSGVRGRCSATPVGTDALLYVGVGGGGGGAGPLVAIRAGAEGQLALARGASDASIAWSVPRAGPPMASPLVYQDCVYILEQRGGIVGCYDASSGEQHYRQRIERAQGFTASPWAHGGHVYCLDESGQTFVLAPGKELNVVTTNKLDDAFWSSVAAAGDRLLLRGINHLYCIAP